MTYLLDLSESDIMSLDVEEARQVFHALLLGECDRLQIPYSRSSCSSAQNVSDGGIDAHVNAPDQVGSSALLFSGFNGFQLKTGTNFSPTSDSHVKKELFGPDGEANLDCLKSSIRYCLQSQGTYRLVHFGRELNTKEKLKAESLISEYFAKCGFVDANVETLSPNQLLPLVRQYPAVVKRILRITLEGGKLHDEWAKNREMRKRLVRPSGYDEAIQKLQEQLLIGHRPRLLQLWSDAGAGKTRFIFEATSDERIKPNVLYFDNPQMARRALSEISALGDSRTVVLIVDDCDNKNAAALHADFDTLSPSSVLLTISHVRDSRLSDALSISFPLLSKNEIADIIKQYVPPEIDANRFAELATPSPRFAHMIGENLSLNPAEPLQAPSHIVDRILAGLEPPNSTSVTNRRVVMRYFALFVRVGLSGPVAGEYRTLCKFISEKEGIRSGQLDEAIDWLRTNNILQGEHTVYITPKAFHIIFWREFWRIHQNSFRYEEFVTHFEECRQLLSWFREMFEYAHGTPGAENVVRDLLDRDGPFADLKSLDSSESGSFFLALTNAAPLLACETLERILPEQSDAELLQFKDGRQHVVWALERIAVWKDLFLRAAELLKLLSRTENATNSNNSTGVLVNLFSLHTYKLAPTEAVPSARLPALQALLTSDVPKDREIAVNAFEAAFSLDQGSRFVGAEHQGVRQEPNLWAPQTYGEWEDELLKYWKLAVDAINTMPEDNSRALFKVLCESAPQLTFVERLPELVVSDLTRLANHDLANRKELIRTATRMLDVFDDERREALRAEWTNLHESLTSGSFRACLERYVGIRHLRFASFEEEENEAKRAFAELADSACADPPVLLACLKWLVSEDAENTVPFGEALGKADANCEFLPHFVNAIREYGDEARTGILGGYLRGKLQVERDLVFKTINELKDDGSLRSSVVYLIWTCGIENECFDVLLELASDPAIGAGTFRILSWGRGLDDSDEKKVAQLIDALRSTPDRQHGPVVALELSARFCAAPKKRLLPQELLESLILDDYWVEEFDSHGGQSTSNYDWTQLAQIAIAHSEGFGRKLFSWMLMHIDGDQSLVRSRDSYVAELLCELAKSDPANALEKITEHIEASDHIRRWRIEYWLKSEHGGGGVFSVPADAWLEWAEQNTETRAPFLASVVPAIPRKGDGHLGLAREVLVRYGDDEDVASAIFRNWLTETWNGPHSEHYKHKLAEVESMIKDEDNPTVLRWLQEAAEYARRTVQDSRIEEERRGY